MATPGQTDLYLQGHLPALLPEQFPVTMKCGPRPHKTDANVSLRVRIPQVPPDLVPSHVWAPLLVPQVTFLLCYLRNARFEGSGILQSLLTVLLSKLNNSKTTSKNV